MREDLTRSGSDLDRAHGPVDPQRHGNAGTNKAGKRRTYGQGVAGSQLGLELGPARAGGLRRPTP